MRLFPSVCCQARLRDTIPRGRLRDASWSMWSVTGHLLLRRILLLWGMHHIVSLAFVWPLSPARTSVSSACPLPSILANHVPIMTRCLALQVVDVAFAPRKFGPCLSTASHDGKIRIFRGSDDQKDINVDHPWNWERQEEFHAGRNRGTPITCHSWNHSPTDMAQSIVVGCGDGSVCVWSYTEAEDGRGLGWAMVCALKTYQGEVHSVSWAPANGRTTHLIASCGATSEVCV